MVMNMFPDLSKVLVLMFTTVVFCKSHNDVQNVATAVNKFGDNIYKELAKHTGNIVFSPFSLHSLLALLTLGTGGTTRQELLSELSLPNTGSLKRGYSAILTEYHHKIEQNPKISSAIFVSDVYSLRNTFKAVAKGFFHAVLQTVDFGKSQQAAAVINKWVENETGQTTSTAVNPESFNGQTAMLLLNTIYFKGEWNIKFDKSRTEDDFVFKAPEGRVKCSMMVMASTKHNAAFAPSFSYLELSFRDTNIKIAFITPYLSDDLANLEQSFDAKTLFAERNNLRPILLQVKIPKFKLNARYSFKHYLISIGLSDIFDNPNFSYLYENSLPAQVDEVAQKTVVEINEDGAIAASATKIQLVARSTDIPQQFVLDQPFLFFIYDSNHKMILIRGRMENPTHEDS